MVTDVSVMLDGVGVSSTKDGSGEATVNALLSLGQESLGQVDGERTERTGSEDRSSVSGSSLEVDEVRLETEEGRLEDNGGREGGNGISAGSISSPP
jgi:hypothetical protein